MIDLRSVWGLETLETGTRPGVRVARRRPGGLEAVSGSVLVKDETRGGFYAWGMEDRIISAMNRCLQFWQTVGVAPPLLVGLTLSGVRGWKVLRGAYDYDDVDGALDRNVVTAPEVILSDFAIPQDVLLRPLFDVVWNGGGWLGSPNYKDGRWIKPR